MVVRNQFRLRGVDREQILQTAASAAGLLGAGAGVAYVTLPHLLFPMDLFARLGILLALATSLSFVARLWMVPRWDGLQGVFCLFTSIPWFFLGFLFPLLGATPIVLGAAFLGISLGGFLTDRKDSHVRRSFAG